MNTKSTFASRVGLIALGALALAGTAWADKPYWAKGQRHDRGYRDVDYARVIDVEPIVRRVRISRPEQECWSEDRPVYRGGSGTVARSTIVGGLIGAAVGHRIGHHHRHHRHHNAAALVGGTLVGAVIGNSIGESRAARNGAYQTVRYDTVRRCQVNYRDDYEESIEGYRVTYVYNGREYTTRMPYDPGRRVLVDVNVRPVIEGRY